jgi:hypothetical protein
MPLGKRQLFLYWRVTSADARVAMRAMRDLQRQLQGQYRGLRAGLYLRSELSAGEATLMETYAIDATQAVQGLDVGVQRHIEQAGAALLQPWLRGTRHVEVFEACED